MDIGKNIPRINNNLNPANSAIVAALNVIRKPALSERMEGGYDGGTWWIDSSGGGSNDSQSLKDAIQNALPFDVLPYWGIPDKVVDDNVETYLAIRNGSWHRVVGSSGSIPFYPDVALSSDFTKITDDETDPTPDFDDPDFPIDKAIWWRTKLTTSTDKFYYIWVELKSGDSDELYDGLAPAKLKLCIGDTLPVIEDYAYHINSFKLLAMIQLKSTGAYKRWQYWHGDILDTQVTPDANIFSDSNAVGDTSSSFIHTLDFIGRGGIEDHSINAIEDYKAYETLYTGDSLMKYSNDYAIAYYDCTIGEDDESNPTKQIEKSYTRIDTHDAYAHGDSGFSLEILNGTDGQFAQLYHFYNCNVASDVDIIDDFSELDDDGTKQYIITRKIRDDAGNLPEIHYLDASNVSSSVKSVDAFKVIDTTIGTSDSDRTPLPINNLKYIDLDTYSNAASSITALTDGTYRVTGRARFEASNATPLQHCSDIFLFLETNNSEGFNFSKQGVFYNSSCGAATYITSTTMMVDSFYVHDSDYSIPPSTDTYNKYFDSIGLTACSVNTSGDTESYKCTYAELIIQKVSKTT
jgi:hypothetical protein